MLTICAWCGITIKEGFKSQGVSHGICDECYGRQIDKAREETLHDMRIQDIEEAHEEADFMNDLREAGL